MKSKTQNNLAILIVLSVIVAICAIFTFVPMQFGDTKYTGIWGNFGISNELYGGLYAEYDIVGDASHSDIIKSMSKIKDALDEQGFQSSNVFSIDDNKVRVEVGFPTSSHEEGFSKSYKILNSDVAMGAFEFRSSQSETDDNIVKVTGKSHIKEISVADYNNTTYLIIEFNKAGEKKFEDLCNASETVYVYMGKALQTSFSVKNVADYSQMQLTVTDFESATDFYFKALFGSISIELNSDTSEINTMSASYGFGTIEGASETLYILIAFVFAVLIAGFVFMAVKYRMTSVLLMPIILFNLIVAGWILCAVPLIEINVTSLLAVSFGIALIFGGSLMYMGRIADEYAQGKTIDASIVAGTKKAVPEIVATSILTVVLSALFALIAGGQITSSCIMVIVFALLNILTNTVLLPWFINLFNKSNHKQGKPFGFKQEDKENV